MHIVMTHLLNGKREVQFLAGGLGWGAAHSVASSFILFWVGARASAFSWRWIQMAMDSSFDLILLFVAMAALTWMATRAASRHLVFVFLTACVFHSFVYQILFSLLGIRGWLLVLARFVYSAAIASGTFLAYSVTGSAIPSWWSGMGCRTFGGKQLHPVLGGSQVQFLAGGLGWGAAHSVASSFILFWVGARASAFSWRWMQMAMDSSFDLILLFVAMAALTWMATRAASRHLVFVFLTACVLHSFVYQILFSLLGIRGWLLVLARFVYSAAIASGTFLAYSVTGSVSQKKD
ncbi:hypothetical protein Aduo_017313 [Ancylostoma duodenale]